jgi:hypothetical protein
VEPSKAFNREGNHHLRAGQVPISRAEKFLLNSKGYRIWDVACHKRAQSHAWTARPSSAPKSRSSPWEKVSFVSVRSYTPPFNTSVRWCCIDLLNAPRLPGLWSWIYNPFGRFAMARSQLEKTRRRLWVAVAVLPVLLVFGLWSTRGEALVPRLVGACVNILFTSWFIFLLRKTKRHDSTG